MASGREVRNLVSFFEEKGENPQPNRFGLNIEAQFKEKGQTSSANLRGISSNLHMPCYNPLTRIDRQHSLSADNIKDTSMPSIQTGSEDCIGKEEDAVLTRRSSVAACESLTDWNRDKVGAAAAATTTKTTAENELEEPSDEESVYQPTVQPKRSSIVFRTKSDPQTQLSPRCGGVKKQWARSVTFSTTFDVEGKRKLQRTPTPFWGHSPGESKDDSEGSADEDEPHCYLLSTT